MKCTNFLKIALCLTLCLSLTLLTACSKNGGNPSSSTASTQSAPYLSLPEGTTNETVFTEADILASLQSTLKSHGYSVGVAYLGEVDPAAENGLTGYLSTYLPGFTSTYPFVKTIPSTDQIGIASGAAFLIVPADNTVILRVEKMLKDKYGGYTAEEELYYSEGGRPIILFDSTNADVTTRLTISVNGVFTHMYPSLVDNKVPSLIDERGNTISKDFTFYNEALPKK